MAWVQSVGSCTNFTVVISTDARPVSTMINSTRARGVSYRELWEDTQARTKALKELDLEVVEIWGVNGPR